MSSKPKSKPKPKIKPKTKTNPNYRRFLDYYMDGFRIREAAKMAGYNPDYGYQILEKLRNLDDFIKLMEVLGITDEMLVRKGKQLLEAKEAKWNPETKQWDTFENAGAQHRAWEIFLRLKGKTNLQGETQPPGESKTLNINFWEMDIKELEQYIEKLLRETRRQNREGSGPKNRNLLGKGSKR
ncbi:MAG: hypothetical protein JXI43_10855 [Tissierellales bacterium]|nr:hypothetical protein [Tissierellales bacterium]